MMRSPTRLLLLLLATFSAHSALAQSIDYDPRRASELRACDEHQYHGRVDQARACYSQLVNSANPVMQAEALWAIGDLQRANECFRDFAKANARAVQPRSPMTIQQPPNDEVPPPPSDEDDPRPIDTPDEPEQRAPGPDQPPLSTPRDEPDPGMS